MEAFERAVEGAIELAFEDCFPIRAEGFDEDVLDGLVLLVTRVEFAAALRLAEALFQNCTG